MLRKAMGLLVALMIANVIPVMNRDSGQEVSSSSNPKRLANSPWPMFHHNLNHTGLSPYDTSSNPGHMKWNFTTGHWVGSSPAIGVDGTIYVGSHDNKLYALNSDGTQKWNFTAGAPVLSSPAIDSDGTIYVGSWDNKVYAVNPDGTEKWNFITGHWLRSSATIGSDGTIYIGSDDRKLYAFNPDGTEKWSFAARSKVHSTPAIGSDGTIYVGSEDNRLYAINPDGTEKWNFTTNYWVCSSPAIGSDGTVYVGSFDSKLYAISPDGTEKWNFSTGWDIRSSPAIDGDGTIYFGSSDRKFYALNPDGTEKWNFTDGYYIHSSPAIGSDGTIFVGSDSGIAYAFNPDGTVRWSYKTGGDVHSSPAIGSDGTVYVGSADTKVYALGNVTRPLPPSVLDATLGGQNWENVTISWALSLDDGAGFNTVTGYEIFRHSTYEFDGIGYGLIASVPNGITEFTDTFAGEGNPSNFFYRVCSRNVDGFGSCAMNQAGKFARALSQGLNLVSIPLIQSNESIKGVLQTVEFDKAWTFDVTMNEWKWFMTSKPYIGELGPISRKIGVWVNVTLASNLTVAGIVPMATTIQLRAGWNLLSFPSFDPAYTAGDLKTETGATRVEGFDSTVLPYFLRVLDDGESFQSGRGYWVHLDSNAIWTVTNS